MGTPPPAAPCIGMAAATNSLGAALVPGTLVCEEQMEDLVRLSRPCAKALYKSWLARECVQGGSRTPLRVCVRVRVCVYVYVCAYVFV